MPCNYDIGLFEFNVIDRIEGANGDVFFTGSSETPNEAGMSMFLSQKKNLKRTIKHLLSVG